MFIYKEYNELKEAIRLKVRAGYHYEQLRVELSLDTRFNKIEYRHFLFNFKSALLELRKETHTEPADVFNLHLARYNKMLEELFTEEDVPGFIDETQALEDQDPQAFEDVLARGVFIKRRAFNFVKVLNTLKQKEDLLGFHRASIKIVIRDTVRKYREVTDTLLVQKIETRLNNLSLEGQINLLNLLKKCKLSSYELADIRPKELEAQALSDAIAQEDLFAQSALYFKEPEKLEEKDLGKSHDDLLRIIRENSNK